MEIYIDKEYKCHAESGDGLTAVETDFCDGKCPEFIEGYRYIPEGQTWARSDGVEFRGEMIAPWKPWEELDAVQREYEREQYDSLLVQLSEVYKDAQAEEIIAKVKADRETCRIVAEAGITIKPEPEAPPNRPGLRWIPRQQRTGGAITWIESDYDASLPGTQETPIVFEAGMKVFPSYFYTLGGARKVWTGVAEAEPEWTDDRFEEM